MIKILAIIVSLYVAIYKLYLSFQGPILVYIINPLMWLLIALLCHINFKNNRIERKSQKVDTKAITAILAILYVVLYYSLGLLFGYTNNPYSTTISGIVINLFSLIFVIYLKEYVRYVFIRRASHKYRKISYLFIFLIFTISDLNILNILDISDFLNLWARELIVPIMFNLLMMYLSYVSDYKTSLISRLIITLPTIIFSVVPDYEWFVIMSFNIFYCIITYLILQYVISKKKHDLPVRLIDTLNPRKWITTLIFILFTISFTTGFFNVVPVVILTGSMKPIINPGDLTIVRKYSIDEINIGDIIQYKKEDYSVVHRVIAIKREYNNIYLIAKGDANKEADRNLISSDQVIGKVELIIPYVGYPSYFIKNMGNNNKEIDIELGGDTFDK